MDAHGRARVSLTELQHSLLNSNPRLLSRNEAQAPGWGEREGGAGGREAAAAAAAGAEFPADCKPAKSEFVWWFVESCINNSMAMPASCLEGRLPAYREAACLLDRASQALPHPSEAPAVGVSWLPVDDVGDGRGAGLHVVVFGLVEGAVYELQMCVTTAGLDPYKAAPFYTSMLSVGADDGGALQKRVGLPPGVGKGRFTVAASILDTFPGLGSDDALVTRRSAAVELAGAPRAEDTPSDEGGRSEERSAGRNAASAGHPLAPSPPALDDLHSSSSYPAEDDGGGGGEHQRDLGDICRQDAAARLSHGFPGQPSQPLKPLTYQQLHGARLDAWVHR